MELYTQVLKDFFKNRNIIKNSEINTQQIYYKIQDLFLLKSQL
jgi:hypothetical protein